MITIPLKKDGISSKCSTEERSRFAELRRLIREKLTEAAYEFGAALLEIRDRKLYREQYESFGAFCNDEFSVSRSRAYELMDQTKVSQNIIETKRKALEINTDMSAERTKEIEFGAIEVPRLNKTKVQKLKHIAPECQAAALVALETEDAISREKSVPCNALSTSLTPNSTFEAGWKFLSLQGLQKLELEFESYRVVIIPKK